MWWPMINQQSRRLVFPNFFLINRRISPLVLTHFPNFLLSHLQCSLGHLLFLFFFFHTRCFHIRLNSSTSSLGRQLSLLVQIFLLQPLVVSFHCSSGFFYFEFWSLAFVLVRIFLLRVLVINFCTCLTSAVHSNSTGKSRQPLSIAFSRQCP